MHIFEWVLGWFPTSGSTPIFNRVGFHVRTNGRPSATKTVVTRTAANTNMATTNTKARG